MRNCVLLLLASWLGLGVVVLMGQGPSQKSESPKVTAAIGNPEMNSVARKAPIQKFADLPLAFERRSDSEFVARGQDYAVDIRKGQVTVAVANSPAIGMEFVRGRRPVAIAESELPGKVNYILGKDPKKWRLGLPTYERVRYRDIYPGIDVIYYGNRSQLEFDLELRSGADVKSVRMRFSGDRKPRMDSKGDAVLGDIRMMVPRVTQEKQQIVARYRLLDDGDVGIELGSYDRHRSLTIDPTLEYSTRLGGGNGYNQGNAIALDTSGNAYIAGYTYAADFPVANSAFAGYNANGDGFISELNSTGTALIYSTYIGGSAFDYLHGIAVDSTGAVWAVGYSGSTDFPLLSPYQSTLAGGYDAVVVKLNPGGSLAYSTYLGGASYDYAYSVAVDPTGNAYVTGEAGSGFPTTAGVFEGNIPNFASAFVTKLSSTGGLVWSTFVGGNVEDWANGIAVDEFGNSYIAGISYSTSFAGAPSGGAQPINRGGADAFVAKLNFNGSELVYFTFLGGSGIDDANAIAVEPTTGVAYIAGQTTSVDLSTSTGAVQSRNAGGYDGFVAELNAAGSAFVYTTYLGGNRNDYLEGLTVDSSGNAYVVGYTDSTTFPTSVPIQSAMQGNSTSLFQSLNTGASWVAFDADIPGTVSAVLPDAKSEGTIVISNENGIYRTTNGGGTWTQELSSGNMSLSRSPANSAVIYGLYSNSVYQSADDGVTWAFMGTTPQCCPSNIQSDPINASVAYVYSSGNSTFGVYRTTNSGANWTLVNSGLPANAVLESMATGLDGSLYVGLAGGATPAGIYKSTNQGTSWVSASSGLYSTFGTPPQGLAVSASNPSTLYATDYFTLYESTNGGASWNTIGSLPGGTNALAISPVDAATLYYSTYYSPNQMFISTNSGETWTPSSGLGVAVVTRILVDPLDGSTAYALASTTHEAVVAKIGPTGQNLLYSSYLGDGTYGLGITTSGNGDTFVTGYVAGYPYNPEFPYTSGALQNNRNVSDGFVARISDTTASCAYSVDPGSTLETWFPHFVQYSVTAPSGCPWTATSNQPWATIVSGASGSGSGVVWVLANNTASTTQAATLTIAGQSVTLTQRTVVNCGYNSFSPEASVVPGSGGTVEFNVVVGTGCPWTITNNDPTAITVVSGASGVGTWLGVGVEPPGTTTTVVLDIGPNLGPNTRTFVVPSPQGDQETISQAGTTAPAVVSTVTSTPSGASIIVSGNGCIPGTFRTPAKLTWNADTNCTISFPSPQMIGGASYSFYSASVNGGPNTTTNPTTVNSGTSPVTVNANFQAPCTYSLSSLGQSFTAAGGLGSFTVITAPQCSWTAAPSANWITILSGPPQHVFQGSGPVSFSVAANGDGQRAGSISAGGQSFNITESAFACSYSIIPGSNAGSDVASTVAVSVNAPTGCPWNAVSNVPWITIKSGGSGSGGGVVALNIASNAGAARSGTVAIGGQTFTYNQGAGACGAVDVTSQVRPSSGGITGVPYIWYTWEQTVTIYNAGPAVPGPINYVLLGLPNQYAGLVYPNDFGQTTCFGSAPSYFIPVAPGGLTPGQSVTFTMQFSDMDTIPTYTPKVLMGTPSH